MPKKDSKKANFRNPTGNGEKLPSSFYKIKNYPDMDKTDYRNSNSDFLSNKEFENLDNPRSTESQNTRENSKDLSPFYGEASGEGDFFKKKSGRFGGLRGTATVGYRPNDKLDISATASGGFSFFLPSKELKKLGVRSSKEGYINLNQLKTTYNLSNNADISAIYNPEEKGFMVRVNLKY